MPKRGETYNPHVGYTDRDPTQIPSPKKYVIDLNLHDSRPWLYGADFCVWFDKNNHGELEYPQPFNLEFIADERKGNTQYDVIKLLETMGVLKGTFVAEVDRTFTGFGDEVQRNHRFDVLLKPVDEEAMFDLKNGLGAKTYSRKSESKEYLSGSKSETRKLIKNGAKLVGNRRVWCGGKTPIEGFFNHLNAEQVQKELEKRYPGDDVLFNPELLFYGKDEERRFKLNQLKILENPVIKRTNLTFARNEYGPVVTKIESKLFNGPSTSQYKLDTHDIPLLDVISELFDFGISFEDIVAELAEIDKTRTA